jgi:hypothetical protein
MTHLNAVNMIGYLTWKIDFKEIYGGRLAMGNGRKFSWASKRKIDGTKEV